MGKSLVIVESPSKAAIINRYLGKDFVVKASVGHIRDLPSSGGRSTEKTPRGAKKPKFTKSGNPDAKYGEALVKAVENSTVFHAWDKEANELAALISVIDDGATTAYIRYLIVAPNYRGKGLNDELIARVKEKYADYPCLYAFAPDDFHASRHESVIPLIIKLP